MSRCLLLGSALVFFTLAPTAQCADLVFTDRTAFNAAAASLGPMVTEGYESYANDLQSGARTITLGSFNVSYNLTGDDSQFGVTDVINPFGGSGIGPTAGSKFLDANYPTASGPSNVAVSFQFSPGTRAFGTDIKDLENANLTFSTNTGLTGVAGVPGADGAVQFFGIITDVAFTSISFSEVPISTGDGVVFDQTSFVAPQDVPEPSTLALLACTLPAYFQLRRKHRKINRA